MGLLDRVIAANTRPRAEYEARERARQLEEENYIGVPVDITEEHIAKRISGKGIYLGLWEPKDKAHKKIGLQLRVFAAPTDLTDASGTKLVLPFEEAAREVSRLRNWHGHDGIAKISDEETLIAQLKKGNAFGKWFIPPMDLLDTKLWFYKEHGALAGSFAGRASDAAPGTNPQVYWSCSDFRNEHEKKWAIVFINRQQNLANEKWALKSARLSCRPVRVELYAKSAPTGWRLPKLFG